MKEQLLTSFQEKYREAYKGILSPEVLAEGNKWFEDEMSTAIDTAYAEGKAYWEPSEVHKDVWREEGRQKVLADVRAGLEDERSEFFSYGEGDMAAGARSGWNDYRTAVLSLIDRLANTKV